MKQMVIVLTAVMALALCSCAERDQKETVPEEPAVASEEAESIETLSREAVFVYKNTKDPPGRMILSIGGEPVLLPSGYVRLVGVVSGGRPIACFAIGGWGLALGKGERINDYRVAGINDDSVILERGQKK